MSENNSQQRIPMNLDPNIYAMSGVRVIPGEEEFIIQTMTGSQMRQYSMTPKHAKRLLLLLTNTIKDYEKKFGELITQLPEVSKAEKKTFGFTTTEESKEN